MSLGRIDITSRFSTAAMLVFALSLLFSTPLSLIANQITSIDVNSSDNRTLIVLKLDSVTPVTLARAEGKSLLITGVTLSPQIAEAPVRGAFRQIRQTADGVEIIASRYVSGQLFTAGAGSCLLILQPAKEPPPPAPRPQASQPQPSQMTSGSRDDLRGSPTPSQKAVEETALTPPGEVTSQPAVNPSEETIQARQVTTVDPTSIIPEQVQLGMQIANQGDIRRALNYLATIQLGEAAYGWSRIVMGELLEQIGEYGKALDHYREALIDPLTESVAAVHLALVFQAQGNPEAASGMWERVIELSGGSIFDWRPLVRGASTHQPQSQPAETPSEEARPSIPLWLTIVIGIGGVAALAGAAFGVRYLLKRAPARQEKGDEFDEYLAGGSDFDTEHDSVGDGATAAAADSYLANSASTLGEIKKRHQQEYMEGEPETGSTRGRNTEEMTDAKRRRVETMYRQGSTVREIAETLGVGQDEVRMAINLAEASES